jgi:disulfide bond formation protein DsbB
MTLTPYLDRWRLCALIACAAMLAIAHGFQTFGGYAPCHLCLQQREVYWVAGAVALGAMVVVRVWASPRLRAASDFILGAAFLVGCGIAVFHAGAEWKFWPAPASCSSAGVTAVSAADLQALMNGAKVRPPACDQAPWVLLGLSMAGWNALASLGLAGLSAWAGVRELRKP